MIAVITAANGISGITGEAVCRAREIAARVKRNRLIATSFAGMLADIAWIGRYDSVGQYDEFRTNVKTRRQSMRCRKRDSCSFPAVIAIKSGTTNRSGSSDITARTWHCFDRGEECVLLCQ